MGIVAIALANRFSPDSPIKAVNRALHGAWPPLMLGSHPWCPGNLSQLIWWGNVGICIYMPMKLTIPHKGGIEFLLMFYLSNFRNNKF